MKRLVRYSQNYSYAARLKNGPIIVKVYNRVEDAAHEFKVISSIKKKNPSRFDVPKTLKLVKRRDHAVMIREYLYGDSLDVFVHKLLARGNLDVVDAFQRVGQALRELHEMRIEGLTERDFGSSQEQLTRVIKQNVMDLSRWGVFSPSVRNRILEFIKNADLTNTILFKSRTLHGDFEYFSHVLLSKQGRIFFLDFDKACRGAPHYDITKFLASLFSSLLIFKSSLRKLLRLREAFLDGYFGGSVPHDSIAITELFMTIRLTRLTLYQFADVEAVGPRYLLANYCFPAPLLALKFRKLQQLLNSMPLHQSFQI